MMEYLLKNGKKVIIRKPKGEDAEAIINVITVADTETLFLARNPGEFCTPVEREKHIDHSSTGKGNGLQMIAGDGHIL